MEQLKKDLQELDRKLLALLNQRAMQVMDAGRKQKGEPPSPQTRSLRDILAHNRGPLPEQALKYLFGEIMAACDNLLNPLRVGFLGPNGSFCHQAALRSLGSSSNFVDLPSVVDVFGEVSRGRCQLGVVPAENSSEAETDITLEQFFTSELNICGEIYAPNNLSLFSLATDLDKITDIYANPLTLSQCRGWLNRNLPFAVLHQRAGVNTAIDAILDKPHAAALGSELAARLARLNILAQDLSDQQQNSTRFLVLGRQSPPPTGHDKTSIMFPMSHQPGFLYHSLSYFKELNLSRIESRPTLGKPWEYSIFIDLPGHVEDVSVAEALDGLKNYAGDYKLLGSYPAG